jgi:Zn-dependent membrane protease YugP
LPEEHNTLSISLWLMLPAPDYACVMHYLLIVLLLLTVIVGPGLWVSAVMKRYHFPRDRYPRTGGETARTLLDSQGLTAVKTEETTKGDHYDPIDKAVRLSPDNFNGSSLTALTVAAHEVGHAIQDAVGFRPLKLRTRLVRWAGPVEKIGAAMLMISPFSAALTRVPMFGIMTFLAGLATLGTGIVVHALTLPTEFDASFGRALPLIREHALLRREDVPRARKLLTAAALTYVSGALQSLLNIARWWAILRR